MSKHYPQLNHIVQRVGWIILKCIMFWKIWRTTNHLAPTFLPLNSTDFLKRYWSVWSKTVTVMKTSCCLWHRHGVNRDRFLKTGLLEAHYTLLNVSYKIASGCISNRFNIVLRKLIIINQSGFIKGRYMGESISTTYDILFLFSSPSTLKRHSAEFFGNCFNQFSILFKFWFLNYEMVWYMTLVCTFILGLSF